MPTGERASASWLASRWIKLLWHCSSCRELRCPLGSSCAVAKRTLFGAIASSCDAECKSLRQLVRHWMICPEVGCHILEGRVPAGIRSRNKAADTTHVCEILRPFRSSQAGSCPLCADLQLSLHPPPSGERRALSIELEYMPLPSGPKSSRRCQGIMDYSSACMRSHNAVALFTRMAHPVPGINRLCMLLTGRRFEALSCMQISSNA